MNRIRDDGRGPQWWVGRAGAVMGLFVALVIAHRLVAPRAGSQLPAGAIRVCGKVALDAKQFVHLVRIGERLLVLLESPQGMQRLSEITDPNEIQRLMDPAGRRHENEFDVPWLEQSSRGNVSAHRATGRG